MKTLWLTYLLCLISLFSFSQIQNDSLQNELKKYSPYDTMRCNILLNYYEDNRNTQNIEQVNLELKKLLLQIVHTPSLTQTQKDWYNKKLVTVLLYEGQDIIRQTANYERALKCYFEMLELSTALNYPEGKAAAYNDISTAYYKQKYYRENISYLEKFIALSKEMKDTVFWSSGLNNLAQSYLAINEPHKALAFFREAIALKKIVEPNKVSVSYNGIGNVFRKMNHLDSAMHYYQQALQLNRTYKLNRFSVRNLANIAIILLELKKYHEAEKTALESMEMAQKISEPEHIKTAAKILSDVYKAMGKPAEALKMLEISSIMKDSIVNDENKQALLKAEFNYQQKLKEGEIDKLEQQNQIAELRSQRKNTIIYSILLLMIVLSLLSYFIFNRYKVKKQNELLAQKLHDSERLRNSERKAAESEIKAIKSQMNPHFFYNALNSIQGYVLSGNSEKASESIVLFSELSRAVLDSSRYKEIALHEEMTLIESYLKLEIMRLPKISYEIKLDDSIDPYNTFVPPMLIQPIIENSIKHGLANKTGEGKVTVLFYKQDKFLIVTVDDNGIGREAAARLNRLNKRKSESFSTGANLSRLELLNENKPEKIEMKITDKTGQEKQALGTTVTLIVPLDL